MAEKCDREADPSAYSSPHRGDGGNWKACELVGHSRRAHLHNYVASESSRIGVIPYILDVD